jgi:hypothetical protein
MKAYFPRVVAGFSVGFAVGGLVAAGLVGPFGGPENLLALDVVTALGFLALVAQTARQFPQELRAAPEPAPVTAPVDVQPTERPRGQRLVLVIFGYQLASAGVTQLLDFMVWERAAARYPDPSDLAQFLGVFGATINVVSVAFVVLVAGWLLTRYGISLGLAANPAGVLVLLVVATALGVASGIGSLAFFVVVCAQQVTDIAFTDGTTRTSINATYQALPVRQRLKAQTRIEGAGVPLALGGVGLSLLAYNALGLDVLALAVFTLLVTLGWLVLAVMAYREYGANLRASLTEHAWDPVALRLDDDASRKVVEDLLRSDDLRDVRTGVELLLDADHPMLTERLASLLSEGDPERQLIGVEAAARVRPEVLAGPLTLLARDEEAPIPLRGLAARVAVAAAPDSADVASLVDDAAAPVRLAALAALAHDADPAGHAARAACVEAITGDDPDDVPAGLLAITNAPHAAFVPALVTLSSRPAAPVELADALAAHADHLVEAARAALEATPDDAGRSRDRLVRALSFGRTSSAVGVLVDHLGHADRDVAATVVSALTVSQQPLRERARDVEVAVTAEVARLAAVLDALVVLGEDAPDLLLRALRDVMASSTERIVDLLGIVHERAPIVRAAMALGSSRESERGLALETLEVTIGRSLAGVLVASRDPTVDVAERLSRLALVADDAHLDHDDRVRELVADPDDFWADRWLRACAVYALPALLPDEAVQLASRFVGHPDPVVSETAASVAGPPRVQRSLTLD